MAAHATTSQSRRPGLNNAAVEQHRGRTLLRESAEWCPSATDWRLVGVQRPAFRSFFISHRLLPSHPKFDFFQGGFFPRNLPSLSQENPSQTGADTDQVCRQPALNSCIAAANVTAGQVEPLTFAAGASSGSRPKHQLPILSSWNQVANADRAWSANARRRTAGDWVSRADRPEWPYSCPRAES